MKISAGNELILRFMLINISSGIAVGMINFIIPVYAISLSASSVEIGLIRGISGLGDLLVVLPAGFLVDYFGSRNMYSVSCVLGVFIILMLGAAGSTQLLLLLMLFYGMARTIRATSLNAAFFKNIGIIGAQKGGWYRGSMTIGASFIGPVIGGLAASAIDFSRYFIVSGAFLLVPLMIILTRNDPQARGKNFSLVDESNHYRSLLENRLIVSATVIESLNMALFITFSTFIAVLVIRDLALSPGIAAMLISLEGGATILVVFSCGRLLHRNNKYLYLISFSITVLALLLLGTSSDIFVLAAASLVAGAGSGLITLATFSQVGSVEGEKGKIAGIFSLGHAAGAILGPSLGGLAGDVFGVRAVFLSFVPLFAALALYVFMEGTKP